MNQHVYALRIQCWLTKASCRTTNVVWVKHTKAMLCIVYACSYVKIFKRLKGGTQIHDHNSHCKEGEGIGSGDNKFQVWNL